MITVFIVSLKLRQQLSDAVRFKRSSCAITWWKRTILVHLIWRYNRGVDYYVLIHNITNNYALMQPAQNAFKCMEAFFKVI